MEGRGKKFTTANGKVHQRIYSQVRRAFVLMPISIFLPKPTPRRSLSLNSIPGTRPETEMQTLVEKDG
jgi:hypothetical protein